MGQGRFREPQMQAAQASGRCACSGLRLLPAAGQDHHQIQRRKLLVLGLGRAEPGEALRRLAQVFQDAEPGLVLAPLQQKPGYGSRGYAPGRYK